MIKKHIFLILLLLILIFGFLVRLYKIDNPVADWHSWRQADTAAVTRNYVKYGVNFLNPRFDDFSDLSGNGFFNPQGNRFVEVPLFNIAHYVLFKIMPFGTLEIWGRMTSIIAALVSAALLFLIIKRHSNNMTGLFAAGFYLFLPYNIYFTRVIIPDPLMVTLSLAALNTYDLSHKHHKITWLILTAVFGGLATAVKPVALFLLLPITLDQLLKYGLNIFRRWEFYLIHLLFSLPFGLWRLWSHRHPEGIPNSNWLLNGNKIRFKGAFFQWIFGARIGALILGKWGVWPLFQGLVVANFYFLSWFFGAMLYLFVVATGNVQHDYYQITIIPAISVILAVGVVKLLLPEKSFSRTWLKRGLVGVSLAFMFAFSWYDVRGLYQINNWSIVHAGVAVDALIPKDAKVAAPYGGDTAFLYQTNRPGFPYMVLPIKDMIDRFNISYYVSVTLDVETKRIMNKYTVIDQKPEYVIVKLVEPIRP